MDHHGQPAQRQRSVVYPVVKDGVLTRGAGLQDQDREEHPPDRVTRAAGRDQGAHRDRGSQGQGVYRNGPEPAGPWLMGEPVERHAGHAEPERNQAERYGAGLRYRLEPAIALSPRPSEPD
jgi:hypothetical protein